MQNWIETEADWPKCTKTEIHAFLENYEREKREAAAQKWIDDSKKRWLPTPKAKD